MPEQISQESARTRLFCCSTIPLTLATCIGSYYIAENWANISAQFGLNQADVNYYALGLAATIFYSATAYRLWNFFKKPKANINTETALDIPQSKRNIGLINSLIYSSMSRNTPNNEGIIEGEEVD